MQKLVTIYLDNTAYGKPRAGCYGEKHGAVEEHLQNYLSEGWRVEKLFGFGGATCPVAQGWVIVALEKDDS